MHKQDHRAWARFRNQVYASAQLYSIAYAGADRVRHPPAPQAAGVARNAPQAAYLMLPFQFSIKKAQVGPPLDVAPFKKVAPLRT